MGQAPLESPVGEGRVLGALPLTPREGEDMGLRPKPHKLFEKSLNKNLMGGGQDDTSVWGVSCAYLCMFPPN